LSNPRGNKIVGVIGHSLGALSAVDYFFEHPKMQNVALFLDEPPFPASWAKSLLPNVAGSFGWWSCDDCGGEIRGIGLPI
jgi:pimeloyl-ACP methyl ester carboxylesterase